MANGKTVSVSDDLARMLDDEVRHIYAMHEVEVSRGALVAGILIPELKRRRAARESEAPKRGKASK